jgi:hypothetical protein
MNAIVKEGLGYSSFENPADVVGELSAGEFVQTLRAIQERTCS